MFQCRIIITNILILLFIGCASKKDEPTPRPKRVFGTEDALFKELALDPLNTNIVESDSLANMNYGFPDLLKGRLDDINNPCSDIDGKRNSNDALTDWINIDTATYKNMTK